MTNLAEVVVWSRGCFVGRLPIILDYSGSVASFELLVEFGFTICPSISQMVISKTIEDAKSLGT